MDTILIFMTIKSQNNRIISILDGLVKTLFSHKAAKSTKKISFNINKLTL
jgi:hypothetical protein